jgi:hypothetical protein
MKHEPVSVPSYDELLCSVVARPVHAPRDERETPDKSTPSDAEKTGKPPVIPTISLSHEALAFLGHVARQELTCADPLTLEEHWKAIGIASGSVKKRVLDELRGNGFIRLARKGRSYEVYIYKRAWDLLGIEPPKAHGRGGLMHQKIARVLAQEFKRQGYEVKVEYEVGSGRKRVDLVAFGKHRRIGIEIALSDVDQELINLRADLNSGVLDAVLVVSTEETLLRQVRYRAQNDSYIKPHFGRIYFRLIGKEKVYER